MSLIDLQARIRRLETLVRGLALEESLWRKCSAPVLAVDRIEYMNAIHQAIHALESARIILAKMAQGLRKDV